MRAIRWTVAAVLLAAATWLLVDQVSWRLRFRPTDYFAALGAFSTALTAVVSTVAAAGVLVYVALTYRLWQESRASNENAHRTSEATLMSQLMVEYDSMRDAVGTIQDYFRRFPTKEAALEAFQSARTAPDQNSEIMQQVDPARFRVSRFFVRIRKLSKAGFVSRRIVWLALQRAAIEDVFLDRVDPLDQVISRLTYGRENVTDRDFFRQLIDDRQQLQQSSDG
jgi:MFS superfamily sulfate permease-like transporter